MTDKDSPQADQPELTAVNENQRVSSLRRRKQDGGTGGGNDAQPGAVA